MKGLMKVSYGGWAMWRGWKDRITKRVSVGECAVSRSVGKARKRWINTMKECLGKRGLDVRQARRMVNGRSEYRGL